MKKIIQLKVRPHKIKIECKTKSKSWNSTVTDCKELEVLPAEDGEVSKLQNCLMDTEFNFRQCMTRISTN